MEICAHGTDISTPCVDCDAMHFDLHFYLLGQKTFSERTFGPGPRFKMVLDHIRKELLEIEADPRDLEEWIDVAILAFDGAWRAGYAPKEIVAQLVRKFAKNMRRQWPDWRTVDPDKAIEHDRSTDAAGKMIVHDRSADASRMFENYGGPVSSTPVNREPPWHRGGRILTLEEVERLHTERVLEANAANMSKTAFDLGIDRRTLYRKVAAWGLKRIGSRFVRE